jgi:hypothetical protein
MAQGREFDRSLLAEIRSRLERLSETQRQLARDHRILTDAATRLRLGRSGEAVLAEIREQSPELLRDYCDIQLTLTAAPLRSIGRLAASA